MSLFKDVEVTKQPGTDTIIYALQSDVDPNLYFYIGKIFAMRDGEFTYTKYSMGSTTPEQLRSELLRNGWHQVSRGLARIIDKAPMNDSYNPNWRNDLKKAFPKADLYGEIIEPSDDVEFRKVEQWLTQNGVKFERNLVPNGAKKSITLLDSSCEVCDSEFEIEGEIDEDSLSLARSLNLKLSKSKRRFNTVSIVGISQDIRRFLKEVGASEHDGEWITDSFNDDIVKSGSGYTNKGKEGTHGTFATKKEAAAQTRAMYANGYKGDSMVQDDNYRIARSYIRYRINQGDTASEIMKRLKKEIPGITLEEMAKAYEQETGTRFSAEGVRGLLDSVKVYAPIVDAQDYLITWRDTHYNVNRKVVIRAKSVREAVLKLRDMVALEGVGYKNVFVVSVSPNDGYVSAYGKIDDLLKTVSDSICDDDETIAEFDLDTLPSVDGEQKVKLHTGGKVVEVEVESEEHEREEHMEDSDSGYVGNARIVSKSDLPKLGDVYKPVPSYGKAIRIIQSGKKDGYTIYRVFYRRPEDEKRSEGLENSASFSFAVKDSKFKVKDSRGKEFLVIADSYDEAVKKVCKVRDAYVDDFKKFASLINTALDKAEKAGTISKSGAWAHGGDDYVSVDVSNRDDVLKIANLIVGMGLTNIRVTSSSHEVFVEKIRRLS